SRCQSSRSAIGAWSLPTVCSQKCGSGVVAAARSQKKVSLLTEPVATRAGSILPSSHKRNGKQAHMHELILGIPLHPLRVPAPALRFHLPAAKTLRQRGGPLPL